MENMTLEDLLEVRRQMHAAVNRAFDELAAEIARGHVTVYDADGVPVEDGQRRARLAVMAYEGD